jgi:hypothetical protein
MIAVGVVATTPGVLVHRGPETWADRRRRGFRRVNPFDEPVIRRLFGGLLVRLVDRFGVGSVSWSR